ncbi:SigB/SigF/SigG family RNA polymerase sigma factor [Streptomyces sp. 4N509B]|uniref:SigB/SigF/SigG family RNA polymerase sigma factor n=1 Tax=Streptomyces sp. 4N509B TaxID=3457413 RepID=UPI003FD3DD85
MTVPVRTTTRQDNRQDTRQDARRKSRSDRPRDSRDGMRRAATRRDGRRDTRRDTGRDTRRDARRTRRQRHPHDDAPDTAPQFRRIAELPPCPEREQLYDDVISAWMPMAGRLARTFRDRGESLDDLEQVAALGLVKAVHRYDPRRGSAFESFAVPTIVGEVKRHFRDHLWGVHVPRRTQELRNRVRAARRELDCRVDDHGPSVAEIAERSGLTQEEVTIGLEALESYSPLSLDAELPGVGEGYTLSDTLGMPDPGYDVVVDREAVRDRLRDLPEREQRILYLRFFEEKTQSRIAEELGISQMHVSRLLNRICTRIHDEVENG